MVVDLDTISNDALFQRMGGANARSLDEYMPRAGDIVFFGGVDHVALYLGCDESQQGDYRHRVISLWDKPAASVLETSIGELVDVGASHDVKAGPPPWS